MTKKIKFLFATLLILLLTHCGQYGHLYLPAEEHAIPPSSASANSR